MPTESDGVQSLIQVGQRVPACVSLPHGHADFDRACDTAWSIALARFGADESGHLQNVDGSDRVTDSVIIEFRGYTRNIDMGGHTQTYRFEAWVERVEDDA